jgi:hypothetical protein
MLAQSKKRKTPGVDGVTGSGHRDTGSAVTGAGCTTGQPPCDSVCFDAEAPWERGREEKSPAAAAVLAIRQTSSVKLRRRLGREGSESSPTAAAECVPPESPPRESDAGASPLLGTPPYQSTE